MHSAAQKSLTKIEASSCALDYDVICYPLEISVALQALQCKAFLLTGLGKCKLTASQPVVDMDVTRARVSQEPGI